MATPVIFSDLWHGLTREPRGGIRVATNADAVLGSVANILGTSKKERPMLREFGASLKAALFEPINDATRAFATINVANAINRWDPRVELVSLDYKPDPDRNQVSLTLSLRIPSFDGLVTGTITI